MKNITSFFIIVLLTSTGCGDQTNSKKSNEPELVSYAETGNLSKIEELLAIGNKVDTLDSCQWSPLMKAAQYGHIDIVKLLLQQGADVEQADKGGYTALLLATSRNHSKIIELLIKQGANINHQEGSMGWTALIWAAKLNYLDSVKILLKNQANQELTDIQGNTALAWAEKNKFPKIAELLSTDN